ncbi:DinB family protein [Paenibacillus alkalitolerans]|uniref:DinB family protein n=1 Tax=Paenibacillus alkalitolerans TaxID=2799335 RepID=UPI0018F50642|nr:DinB family protein [Paenibacillus alkalitolerans]
MKQIVENLITTRRLLLDEIEQLDIIQLNRRLSTDSWSIGQVCHHLILTEALFTQAIQLGLSKEDDHSVYDKPIELVLDRTKKIESPGIARPSNEQFTREFLIDGLTSTREKILKVINDQDDPSIFSRKTARHLVFKELKLDQWITLLYLHEQRHIKQIQDIKKNNEERLHEQSS